MAKDALVLESEEIDDRFAVHFKILAGGSRLQLFGRLMKELADDTVGHPFDDLLGILIKTIELAQRTAELRVGDRSGVLVELRQ